jgi:Flp pilus assembly pilin Flp
MIGIDDIIYGLLALIITVMVIIFFDILRTEIKKDK